MRKYLTSDHILCGNFNLELLDARATHKDASNFSNHMQSRMLLPSISGPTRTQGSSCTLIDNIL